ncbi:2Fe-2S iron-sulfur cluster-binding protein [Lutimaribacter sp. EGI FJ00015]|uniref:2Fe-2S iron-sulfur cluster-binding protein n=1 Tax=Lutimaribacter degradans TaxID=2945989 RepID=A0ACC5ZX08_9RHOB|nr:2Fe-2S iron-sulfur cluster-binding protein [Lutimaribacter sp. EGI FJ00013]MCM2562832.1 2Fe-2S iron-sulfur cluster-binding protein [Lutimaribacter sp. EGI FJ00013]MCO0613989.1 2Fe-2S iron-sulfur cluster-binding protein [Lutimaribacter sp. EGI FJ00015]
MMFHDLTIRDVRHETPDAVSITFETPEGGFDWKPGQYLTLRADVRGEDARRSYSIASLPGQPLCVGVKKVEGGLFSPFCQDLKPGDSIAVMPPEGRFVTHGENNLVLIAAGSGITPMVSIAGEALARGARVTLVYGNRNFESIMFRDQLDALKDRYVDRFTLIHVLSREPQDVDLLNGRITGEKIAALGRAGAIDLDGADGVFLCGPGDMIDDVTATLEGQGVPRERIHFERFYQDGEAPRAPRSAQAQAAAEAGASVEVILDGTRRQFTVSAEDDTVLDAAARVGLELPYSCKGGMCCTCRCKVTDGSAEMAVNYSLEPWELEAGFTLACQTRPTSDKLVLDFDAA